MVGLDEILSDVQNKLGDLTGQRIADGEWIAMLNRVIGRIAQETHIWIGRYKTIPNQGSTTPVTTVTIPYQDNNNTLAPYRITKVTRQNHPEVTWLDSRELPPHAIERQNSGDSAYPVNGLRFNGASYAYKYADENNNDIVNDSRTLIFSDNFDDGEEVTIDFVQGQPFRLQKWEMRNPPVILDFLEQVAIYGLCTQVYEKTFGNGNFSHSGQVGMFNNKFKEELMRIKPIARNYITDSRSMMIQPKAWMRGFNP